MYRDNSIKSYINISSKSYVFSIPPISDRFLYNFEVIRRGRGPLKGGYLVLGLSEEAVQGPEF
jgi:hypothetical protein